MQRGVKWASKKNKNKRDQGKPPNKFKESSHVL
jgi:hypothetical protein